MENVSSVKDIVLLFDRYSMESQNLHKSFKLANRPHIAVVIEDDGFLDDNVISVFASFLPVPRRRAMSRTASATIKALSTSSFPFRTRTSH